MKALPATDVPEPPADGAFVELDAGILWLRLPIPGALRHINVWLVPGQRGWLLVDTGMAEAGVAAAWERLHAALPLAGGLEGILVTHHHPDHMGMAATLAERHGVPVFASAEALAAARRFLAPEPASVPDFAAFAARHGLELDEPLRLMLAGKLYSRVVAGLPRETRELRAGEVIATRQANWTVSIHHGHAPGHVCLHAPALRVLVSGDQVLPAISSHVGLFPANEDEDPLGEYLASFEALAALPRGTLVLPAHGRPFRTLHERMDAVRAEHLERLGALEQACQEPAPTGALVERLFRLERLDTLNRLLATCETLAHLRWLECRGRIRREGHGPALRWRRAA